MNSSVTQFIPIYEELKIPVAQAQARVSEISRLSPNTILTYNLAEASANLTSAKTAITAALTKLTAAISASRTTAATLQQSAGQEAVKLQTVIDKANTDLATLNAKITSALAEINRLSATVGLAPTIRLLQSENIQDSDMEISEINGADVSQFSSGA